jgi:capsular polysaccharide biosynthesis protein/MinD-like ATPase involved in chromosome partitioning or flagellar assembly
VSELAPPLSRSLRFARRQGWLVLLVPILAVATAALIVQRQESVYRASMGVIVAQAGGNFQVQLANQQTMKNILESDVIAEEVVQELELPISSSQLRRKLRVEVKPDSSVLVVSYDSSDGQQAVAILEEVASAFQALIREQLGITDNFRDAGPLQIVADVIDPPHLNSQRILPQPGRVLGFAGILGLALGLILAFARESLDDRIRERREAEEWFGAPVVGTLPRRFRFDPRAQARRERQQQQALELLWANVQLGLGAKGRSLLITSSTERGDTSTVVADLSVALARAGQNVICVETEANQPVHDRLMRATESPNGSPTPPRGLMEVIEGTVPLEDALQEVQLPEASSRGDAHVSGNGRVGRVMLLSASGSLADSAGGANSQRHLSRFMQRLSAKADCVFIDSPAILSTGTTLSLASAVDGVLVVARRGRTRRGPAEAVHETLRARGVQNVGVVLLDTPSFSAALL